jgi:putative DNA primase/helicase
MKFKNWDFRTAACEIDKIIGRGGAPMRLTAGTSDAALCRREIEVIVRDATAPDVVQRYLAGRGLRVSSPMLLGHPACPYYDDERRFLGRFPAVIAPVVNANGVLQCVQRIYDADLEPRKKTMRPAATVNGCAVRLFEPERDTIGLTEGIENALAVWELYGIAAWAALSSNGIESFEPPVGISAVVIFGDHDRNFVGQAAAYRLAKRLAHAGMTVDVRIPPQPGIDWLDMLRSGQP